MPYAVFTMVGPGDVEVRRLRTLGASLFRHEPGVSLLVIVDDTGGDVTGHVTDLVPPTCELVRLVNPSGQDHNALATNTVIALRYLVTRTDLSFALKLDTDAMVVGPFAGQIEKYFAEHPAVGQVGRAGTKCDGTPTPMGIYVKLVRRLNRRLQVWRSPTWGAAQAFVGDFAKFRMLLRQAAANGAAGGLHCQGGAYAVSRAALDRLRTSEALAGDWATRVCGFEDLLCSTMIAAAGLKLVSLTAAGEPFGVEAAGLPFSPEELAAKGYALVHSIKNDPRYAEADVVRFFETRDGVERR